jgi:NMD protein affecting ribosome stability and mRNA decay
MSAEVVMTTPEGALPPGAERQAPEHAREVRVGDQQCPRCRKWFTLSYWTAGVLVQARCLSCDLKWPRPDVV